MTGLAGDRFCADTDRLCVRLVIQVPSGVEIIDDGLSFIKHSQVRARARDVKRTRAVVGALAPDDRDGDRFWAEEIASAAVLTRIGCVSVS